MNEKKVQSRKRNQNQTQKKSRDRQAQPRNTFGNQYRSQFQAAFQIFCRRWLPVCIAALILSGTANLLRESRLQQEVAAKIVRFHVRANSDCASDQQIKLQVRDAVAEELQTILHGAETKAETEEILRENEPSIRAAALQTLRAGGSTDDITVTYGKASFEEKETGNYILPAGTYDALQINIGRAKGHNWWCMLYPSICFSDALRPVNEDGESAEKVEKSRIPLQNLLSDAAYREICLLLFHCIYDFFCIIKICTIFIFRFFDLNVIDGTIFYGHTHNDLTSKSLTAAFISSVLP